MTVTDLELRQSSATDLSLIRTIDPRLAGDPAHARFVARVLDMGESWLALVDGAPAGYALASRHFFDRPFIDTLVVAPPHRRLGVGEALMARCEAAHDDDRIFTSTNRSNQPMRALLAKAGWKESGFIDNLDPGDPELVFVKFRLPA